MTDTSQSVADGQEEPLFHGEGGSGIPVVILLDRHRSLDNSVVEPIYEQLRRFGPPFDEIHVWLDTPGGSADDAYWLTVALRSVTDHVKVVVPRYAKSAGTLLALCGNEIFMAPVAELGPLDAQIVINDERRSALDIARAMDAVIEAASNAVLVSGGMIGFGTGLDRKTVLDATSHLVSDMMVPLVNKLDPAEIYRASQTLDIAKEYAERIIARAGSGADGTRVASTLINEYPHHGFVIDPMEARGMGLPIRDIREYAHREAVELFYQAYVGTDHTMGHIDVRWLQDVVNFKTETDDEEAHGHANDGVDNASDSDDSGSNHPNVEGEDGANPSDLDT